MGLSLLFGFVIFILLPVSLIILIFGLVSKKNKLLRAIGSFWLFLFGLATMFSFLGWMMSKTILDKCDYHGTYVVKREYFKGVQSDWQYNSFRFEITEQDSIFFYETEKEIILKTYRGTIRTSKFYESARLVVSMEQPTHHILQSNPITYRGIWSFYLVFNSPEFNNVFFKKGKWKPID